MSNLTKLKNFVIRISRSLNRSDLSKFGPQLFTFCHKEGIPIPPHLHNSSSFIELMGFAFKQNLITPNDTYLISKLLYSAEGYDLCEELYNLEKKFTEVERKHSSHIDNYVPISSHETSSAVKKQPKFTSSSKSDVRKLFSKRRTSINNTSKRINSGPDKTEYSYTKRDSDNNLMLTDPQVIGYCSQISPDEWKQLAVIGFGLTFIEVDRIDHDRTTIQDKVVAIFMVWKNQSFAPPYSPPFTKQGFKQALITANLNGLIYRLNMQ